MPKLAVEIPDLYQSVTRPVVLGVVRELITRLGIPEGSKVQFNGAIESAAQPGSNLTSDPTDPPASFPFTSKVTIEVSEDYLEDMTLSTAVFETEQNPFFIDPHLEVFLKPVYVTTQMSITFRYRAEDRSSADAWRNELRRRASQGRAEMLHGVDYDFAIPPEFLVILTEIFDRREAVAGYGETLDDYFKQFLTPQATTLVNLAGHHPSIVVKERQLGIVGWFDFTSRPENAEQTSPAGSWECGFTYTFNFDKPITAVMQYPISVHSQLLSKAYRPTERPYALINEARRPSYSRRALDEFTVLYTQADPVGGMFIPEFDDWVPHRGPQGMAALLTLLMAVEPDDPRELVNLHELGSYSISPTILDFFKSERRYLTQRRASFFYLCLYEGHTPLSDTVLEIDEALTVRATEDLDQRKVYHLQLNLVVDTSILQDGAIDRLRKYPDAARETIDAIGDILYVRKPGLSGNLLDTIGKAVVDASPLSDLLVSIGGGKLISRDSMEAALELRTDRQRNRMKTVQTSGIIVHRT